MSRSSNAQGSRVAARIPAAARLCLLFVGLAAGPVRAQTDDPHFERVAERVAEKMQEFRVPGVALGILYRGASRTRGFGVTSIDNPLPVTDETLFQVGSISKTFTGTLVMRLVETGKLRLEAPVREHMPAFRVRDETASRQATVATLLTHMGGWEGDFFDDTGNGDEALAKVTGRMAGLEQVAPFNRYWSYNNAGFYAAGRLVELATGKTYEQALRDLLLDPLGLNETVIFPADVMTYRFAVGHGGPGDELRVMRPWALARAAHAVGGVVASVKDLLRYGQFHLGDGTVPDGGQRILSPEGPLRMQATQVVKHGMDDEEMGVTWQISTAGGLRQISHGGSTHGQQALLTLVPAHGFAVALLTNSSRGGQLNRDATRAAIQEYLGVAITDPRPVTIPEAELIEYVGRYSRPFQDVAIQLGGGRLMIQAFQKQGFPTPATPIPPPQPPVPYAFYAKDQLIATDGPQKGARAQFIRNPDGSIGWIRLGGRLNKRQVAGTSEGR